MKQINEAGLGKTLGTLGALAGGAYAARKAGQFIQKNPQAVTGALKTAGQVGSTLLQLIAPIVKEVGPAVAKSIIKRKYGIDIPDVTLNAVKNNGTVTSATASTPASSTAGTPPVLPTASSTTASGPAVSTTTSSSPVSPAMKIAPRGTAAALKKDTLKKEITKLNDRLKYQATGSAGYRSVSAELQDRINELESLPESAQIEILNEFIPALVAAGEVAAPVIGRALASNAVKQIATQAALQAGTTATSKAINKLQQKKASKDINNNEMEEMIKSKEKKINLASEGIGTGTLGAVAGGLMGGPAGAVLGGITGAAAPKAVKEIKGAFEGEEEKEKKNKKKKMKESTDLAKFVYNISQKNYAEANKYLKDAIDSKLKERIESSLNNNKLF